MCSYTADKKNATPVGVLTNHGILNHLQREPKLNTKLRRDDTMSATIKTERISTDAQVNASKIGEIEPSRNVRVKREKEDNPSSSTMPSKTAATNDTTKKLSKDSVCTTHIKRYILHFSIKFNDFRLCVERLFGNYCNGYKSTNRTIR